MGSEEYKSAILAKSIILTILLFTTMMSMVQVSIFALEEIKVQVNDESNSSDDFILFDEFEGNSLNSSTWNWETDKYSTITLAGGILTTETDPPSEWHPYEGFGFTDLRINHGDTYGTQETNAVTFARHATQTLTPENNFRRESVIPAKQWFIGEIHWESESRVTFKIDNQEFIHNEGIPNVDLPIGLIAQVIYPGPGTHWGSIIKSNDNLGKPGISMRMRLWMDATPDGDGFLDGGTLKCDWIYVWNSSFEDPNYLGDKVSENYEENWNNLYPSVSPPARNNHGAVYDSINQKTIIFGGWNGHILLDDTWSFNYKTNQWVNLNPSNKPSARCSFDLVYDKSSQKIILFGGQDRTMNTPLAETWEYDYSFNTWTNLNPENSPEARWAHTLSYDDVNQKTILFGGFDGSNTLSDTWIFDTKTNNWSIASPAVSPNPREEHSMVYDTNLHAVILFGGRISSGQLLSDTWHYNYTANTWTELQNLQTGKSSYGHSMAYNIVKDQIVMFGGYDGTEHSSETWICNATEGWTKIDPMNSPVKRHTHSMTYDIVNNKIIMFGGWDSSKFRQDTWEYGLISTDPPTTTLSTTSPADSSQSLDGTNKIYENWLDTSRPEFIILLGMSSILVYFGIRQISNLVRSIRVRYRD